MTAREKNKEQTRLEREACICFAEWYHLDKNTNYASDETKEKSLLIFQPLFAKGRLIFEFVVMERISHCKSRGSKEVSNLLSTTAIRQRVLSEG